MSQQLHCRFLCRFFLIAQFRCHSGRGVLGRVYGEFGSIVMQTPRTLQASNNASAQMLSPVAPILCGLSAVPGLFRSCCSDLCFCEVSASVPQVRARTVTPNSAQPLRLCLFWVLSLVAEWIRSILFGRILPTIKPNVYTFWGL